MSAVGIAADDKVSVGVDEQMGPVGSHLLADSQLDKSG